MWLALRGAPSLEREPGSVVESYSGQLWLRVPAGSGRLVQPGCQVWTAPRVAPSLEREPGSVAESCSGQRWLRMPAQEQE